MGAPHIGVVVCGTLAHMTAGRFRIVLVCAVASAAWLAAPAGRLAVVSVIVLFAPGFVLTRALPLPDSLPPIARPALWLGLSMSLVALLYQWLTTFGLALNTVALACGALACAAGVLWRLWRNQPAQAGVRGQGSGVRGHATLIGMVFLLTLGLRLYQIRDLVLPAWVDSVHHALLIRVAIERGQAPIDLYPYLPISRLPYHWGYHVLAAASAQLANVTIPQAMLWQGQALNALHVLTCAALAAYFWRRPSAGIVAGMIVGLLSIMPAYYVTWGRYTQLVGLLLLPPLAIIWHMLLRQPSWQALACAAVLLAGLNLIHFRVLIFALVLLAALTTVWALRQTWARVRSSLAAGGSACIAAMLLTAPWLWLLLEDRLIPTVARPASFFASSAYAQISAALLWAGNNQLLVALALLAALWSLRRNALVVASTVLWIGGLLVLANPVLLPYLLPAAAIPLAIWAFQRGTPMLALAAIPLVLCNPLLIQARSSWLVTNDVIVISLFIPISLLIAGPAGQMLDCLWDGRGAWRQVAYGWALTRTVAIVSMLALGGWGLWAGRDVVNPSTVLASSADIAAITWIEVHTAPDARFLIGAAPWLPSADRGVDGGWWLLPLAGRWTSTPPVIFDYGPADYVRATRERTHRMAALYGQNSATTAHEVRAEVARVVATERIDYIYLGPNSDPLTRAALPNVAGYRPVYEHDGVTILAVGRQT